MEAGTVVTREHLNALNDAVQHRLSDIEDTINREQDNVRSLTAAKRDLVRREIEQAIDEQRQGVEGAEGSAAQAAERVAAKSSRTCTSASC